MQFNNFTNKAKTLYDQEKDEAHNVVENVKKEATSVNERVKENINKNTSAKNELVVKGEDYVDNPTISKAAQLIYEKSIDKAEHFIDKYIRPYNVFEIIESEFADEIIK